VPITSHLLFADDCFLFFKGSASKENVMKNILASYEATSGQAIDFQKSETFCSRNTPPKVRTDITNIMGVRQTKLIHEAAAVSHKQDERY
jgi:vacuolar-type H+-ATPase subunit D/Vma8